MTNLLHSTWFWLVIIASPAVTMIGILARLLRPPPSDSTTGTESRPADDAKEQRHLPDSSQDDEPE